MVSMTNRFGRLLDRSRQLGDALHHAPQPEQKRLKAQLAILSRQARLHVEAILLRALLFVACLISLIISLLAFLQDINLTLGAHVGACSARRRCLVTWRQPVRKFRCDERSAETQRIGNR